MKSDKKIIFFLFAAACTAPQPPPGAAGPAEAVRDFAEAVHKGDTATAWSLLTSRAQAQADQFAAAARAATDAGPESGRQMLFTSALPGRVVDAKAVSQSGDSAEVQTSGGAGFGRPQGRSTGDGGAPRVWHVVREGGRWRIDLDLGH